MLDAGEKLEVVGFLAGLQDLQSRPARVLIKCMIFLGA
jgi:hypothetical protein